MKLVAIKLHNYRAVIDVDVSFRSYGLLVGANNAGKSSIIDALRAFYEKDGFKFSKEKDLPLINASDDESWIELTFTLTDEEHGSLKEDYQVDSKELRVRKFFQTSCKTLDGKSAAGSIFAYRSDGELSREPFYGAKNVQSGKFGDLVYIPAMSRVDEHVKLSGPSALRDLLADIMKDVVAGGRAYSTFSSSIETFAKEVRLEKTSDARSLSGLELEINGLISPWQVQFNLSFPPPSSADIVKSMLSWEVIDQGHGKAQAIENYGSGFQRHFIFSLIQLGVRYAGKATRTKSKDFTPSLNLLLFEEPEAFLHPPQQEILARNLAALAEADGWQVLCATHSPHFVSRNVASITSIARLDRSNGNTRAYQISQRRWNEIADANQIINAIAAKYPKMAKRLHADDAKPEMEAVKNFLWLNPDRSSLFFANHVLLVEGPTEVAFINKLISQGKIGVPDGGVYVLDCIGKFNIHRFMNLLRGLGVSHSVLHDDDLNVAEHAEINQLIQDTMDPEYTMAIHQLNGTLEQFLGVPSAGSDHRKPQHILYLHETGQIDQLRIDEFCAAIESCLPSKG